MERPPLVRDLMVEVEKKSRVTLANQQLLYRGEIHPDNARNILRSCFLGQRLHQTPEKGLEEFGLFNGNRILLVGDTVRRREGNTNKFESILFFS